MSRIGLKPITLPAGVEVKVDDKNLVSVKGPKGELQEKVSSLLTVENKDGVVTVSRSSDAAEHRAQHGLARTLISNMVKGVTEGYEKKLLLVGVGYKAEKKGNQGGYEPCSLHPIELEDQKESLQKPPDATTVIVKDIDKAQVGNYAANIRAYRRPEPYKGKGIKYDGEVIRRKEGKTGASS